MGDVKIGDVALNCGYKNVFNASDKSELEKVLPEFLGEEGPVLLIVDVSIGSRKNLGRPTTTPIENKNAFMKKLEE